MLAGIIFAPLILLIFGIYLHPILTTSFTYIPIALLSVYINISYLKNVKGLNQSEIVERSKGHFVFVITALVIVFSLILLLVTSEYITKPKGYTFYQCGNANYINVPTFGGGSTNVRSTFIPLIYTLPSKDSLC